MSRVSQDTIRDCFGIGQTVLVRSGRDWVSREILDITVLRNNATCRECDRSILGEPRFWFKDYGNIPLEDIMAKEDIDPNRITRSFNVGPIVFPEQAAEAKKEAQRLIEEGRVE